MSRRSAVAMLRVWSSQTGSTGRDARRKGPDAMFTFSPSDCQVNELRRREILATSERLAALQYGAPTAGRRTSLAPRLVAAFSRPVRSLVPRRSFRPSLEVAPRS